MSDFKIDIEGFPELIEKIKKLGNDKDKKREVLMILRNVAKPTVRAAKNYAPVARKKHTGRNREVIQPGNLKKSIGTITGRKGKAKDNPTIYVGPRAKGKNKGWYGHFVEVGVNVYHKGFKRKHKRGANDHAAVRRTKGQYYMKRAHDLTNGQVTADAEKQMIRFIKRRIDKLSS